MGAPVQVPSKWSPDSRLAGVLLVLAVVLAYLPAILGAGFHYDDSHHIVGNPAVRPGLMTELVEEAPGSSSASPAREGAALRRAAREPGLSGLAARCARFFVDAETFSGEPGMLMYRPVLMVTYAVDHFAWGYRPEGWVLTNTLLHALVALLVWRLALGLGLAPGSSLLAGVVMGLHPVFSETVNYVSSRSESVAALFLVGALLLHLHARADGTRHRAGWLAAAWVTGIVACLAKTTAAPFAAAVVLIELFRWRRPWRARFVHAFAYGALYAAGLAVVLALRGAVLKHAAVNLGRVFTVKPGTDPRLGGGRSIVGNLLLQSRVAVMYVQLLLKPVRLNVDHHVALSPTHAVSTLAAVAIHVGTWVAAVVAAVRGHRFLPLCIGLFWVLLSVSVVVPLNVIMNEHRLYLPGIAVALLAGGALGRVADLLATRTGDPRRAVAYVAVPVLLFVPLVVQRSLEWRSDTVLWDVARERAPLSASAHLHYGAALHAEALGMPRDERLGIIDRALEAYGEAEKLHPGWLNLQLDLGNAWLTRAQCSGADEDFERSVAAFEAMGRVAGQETARWRMNKAATLLEWGKLGEAEAIIRRLRSEDETDTTIYDEPLARILRKKGDAEGAAEAMRRVVADERRRSLVDAMLTLGWWHFEDAVAARRSGRPQGEIDGHLAAAEKLISEADTIADRTRDKRPALYIARFLYLMGQPDHEAFRNKARAMGWRPEDNPREMAWSKGGVTPWVDTGTVRRR